MKYYVLLFLFIAAASRAISQTQGQYTDPRDGKVYKTIKIGNQVWMAENLAYKPLDGNYWTYNNDISNIAKYGYLYDWVTAKKACPPGWHLPDLSELQTLLDTIGGAGHNAYDALISEGISGFNSLPGGWRSKYGFCNCIGSEAAYWSSTLADDIDGFHLYINSTDESAGIFDFGYMYGECACTVRCIKD